VCSRLAMPDSPSSPTPDPAEQQRHHRFSRQRLPGGLPATQEGGAHFDGADLVGIDFARVRGEHHEIGALADLQAADLALELDLPGGVEGLGADRLVDGYALLGASTRPLPRALRVTAVAMFPSGSAGVTKPSLWKEIRRPLSSAERVAIQGAPCS
jgi:hypothetical protein